MNDMTKTLQILGILALLALFALGGYLVGRRFLRPVQAAEIARTDTLRVRDTVIIDRPVPVTIRTADTLLVAVSDTVRVRDTVYVSLPREERVYEGDDYRAQVSGYRPALDWIEVYPETRIVTNAASAPAKRWGIGIQAGYGAYVSEGQARLAPYVGVGVSYDLIRF